MIRLNTVDTWGCKRNTQWWVKKATIFRTELQGAEKDSWSCLGMGCRNRKWGLMSRDKPEQEQRDVPGPVLIE